MPELSAIAKSVKSVGIQSLGELISLVELLNTSLLQEKVLVIIDGFQILLLAQKVYQNWSLFQWATVIMHWIIIQQAANGWENFFQFIDWISLPWIKPFVYEECHFVLDNFRFQFVAWKSFHWLNYLLTILVIPLQFLAWSLICYRLFLCAKELNRMIWQSVGKTT